MFERKRVLVEAWSEYYRFLALNLSDWNSILQINIVNDILQTKHTRSLQNLKRCMKQQKFLTKYIAMFFNIYYNNE